VRRIVTSVIVLLSINRICIGQDQRSANLITAQGFLRAAYPQLSSMTVVVQLVKTARFIDMFQFTRFRVYVNEGDDIKPSQYADALLATEFTFGTTGRIEDYFASGRLVRDVENTALAHDVERHAEWSPAMIASELVRRGAVLGPDSGERLMTVVPSRALEPMLGELTLLSSEFKGPTSRERRQGLGGDDLHWQLTYQSSSGLQVRLLVEPFGGMITYVLTAKSFN
jgi:hypothetical protein